MPDNVTLPGTGSVVEAVEVGGALRQVVQVGNLPATQPVSAAALPLPTGAATETTAAALLTAAQAIKTAAETLAGRTINTGAVSGTVALDGTTLAALESITASIQGTVPVTVGNFPATQTVSGYVTADTGLAQPLTNSQLRAEGFGVEVQDGAGTAIDSLSGGPGARSLLTAMGATNFQFSSGNSSAVQLASGATFTGTIETILNQQCVSVLLVCERSGTLTITQYIDAAGAQPTSTWVYATTGGVPFSRAFTANGNYVRLSFANSAGASTTGFRLDTYYGTLPPATNLGNMPVSLDEVAGTALTLGQKAAAASIPVVLASGVTPAVDTELAAAAALADAAANATTATAGAAALIYNGATWDRQRGNWNINTGDTGAKTATGNGATQTNFNARGATVVFNIGTVTGTSPTAAFKLQGSADGGTTWYDIPGAATASITATGVYVLQLYPGVTAVANAAVSAALPRTWRVVWTIGGTTPSFTITNIQVAYQL